MSVEFLERRPEEFDASRAALESLPAAVRMARRAARNDAISYRNVKVGAAIKFYDEETYQEAVLSGSNVKARPTDETYCAETDVIDYAQALGLTSAKLLVIAGPSRLSVVQSISQPVTDTLQPCGKCRHKMAQNSEIVNDETLIVTVSTEENIYQAYMADELRMLYEATETSQMMFLESATPLRFEAWGEHIDLYDQLKARNPRVSTQFLAKIALENIVEVPDIQ